MKDCTNCNGTGIDPEIYSECCGAPIPHYPDYDICLECKEHCAPAECEECDGRVSSNGITDNPDVLTNI